jgi:hypothetical protein
MTLTFPLGLWDISLLLAAAAIVLIATSELLSPHNGKTNLPINKKRLRNATLTTSTLFLATVVFHLLTTIIFKP